MIDTAHGQAVKPDDRPVVATHVGLRAAGPLIVECMALQKLIQGELATIERFDGIGCPEFANGLKPRHASVQNAGLRHQLLEARQRLRRCIEGLLKRLPLLLRQDEVTTICQRLVGRNHPGIQQELADVFVARTRCLLQQLLDSTAGADIDAFGFGEVQGTHGNPHVLKHAAIIASGRCADKS